MDTILEVTIVCQEYAPLCQERLNKPWPRVATRDFRRWPGVRLSASREGGGLPSFLRAGRTPRGIRLERSHVSLAVRLFAKQITNRGYETGTSAWAREGTRGHGRHALKPRFAAGTWSRVRDRARRYRPRTSMVRRASAVRVRQRALQTPAKLIVRIVFRCLTRRAERLLRGTRERM